MTEGIQPGTACEHPNGAIAYRNTNPLCERCNRFVAWNNFAGKWIALAPEPAQPTIEERVADLERESEVTNSVLGEMIEEFAQFKRQHREPKNVLRPVEARFFEQSEDGPEITFMDGRFHGWTKEGNAIIENPEDGSCDTYDITSFRFTDRNQQD